MTSRPPKRTEVAVDEAREDTALSADGKDQVEDLLLRWTDLTRDEVLGAGLGKSEKDEEDVRSSKSDDGADGRGSWMFT